MTQTKGIDWKNVTFITGVREDQAKEAWKENAYRRDCGRCAALTFTEVAYPVDVPLLCNVCASEVTAEKESDPQTQVLWTVTYDVKAWIIGIAQTQGRPTEEVVQESMEWRMGRASNAGFDSGS